MEPVILIVAVTAIISGTYLRSKKINLEKERLRLNAGVAPKPEKKGLFSRAKNAIPPLVVSNNKSAEITKLHQRLENLEVILLDQANDVLDTNDREEILREMRGISGKIRNLEHS